MKQNGMSFYVGGTTLFKINKNILCLSADFYNTRTGTSYVSKKKYMGHKLHFLISQEQNMILIFSKEILPAWLMSATKSFWDFDHIIIY